MKKILVLNYEFPPLGGGAGNATYYLLKEFAKDKDLQIDLITSSLDKYKEEVFADNIKIYYLDIGKQGNIHYQSNKDLIKYAFKAHKLAKRLNQQNSYDLVHAFFGIPCGFVAMLLKRPYIVSLRGSDVPFYNKRFYWLDKFIFQHLSKVIWKKAKAVVANSQGLKDLAQKTVPNQEVAVIYNGIDMDEFRPVADKSGEFTIISTSRLIRRKGIEHLISAFIDFEKIYHDAKLIIVGDGDLKDELSSIVNSAGVDGKVDFHGSVSHDKLPELYRSADVFVLPSLNEGMSNSLLEAMASGLAIIATDTGGTGELVDDQNGIIVAQNSAAEIYDALETIYNDKDLLNQMKISSREKVAVFSWAKVGERYKSIYNN
ncbi:MAG: glycosyltransferase family 4 protein [Patescibacteria group bacterium]|jgi:glycosyltransferase involved in cell wall biosynthesis